MQLSEVRNIVVPPVSLRSPLVQQINVLHVRVNDLTNQLNTVMKTMADENEVLRKENAELKVKLVESSKS